MWLILLGAALVSLQEVRDLSKLLTQWPDQYVRWIITDGERARYRALESETERLEFIEEFWHRRDPTPGTTENEYRREYLERFATVLHRFGAGKPGWATDRGRIYLLLGPPNSIQQNPMGRYSLERPSEIWSYNNLDVPGIPASIDVNFVDFKGTGDFEIVSDLESTAPVLTEFGTAESPLLALALRRGKLGRVDPRTGLDTYRESDSTRLTMRELDLQQQLRAVEDAPKRVLAPLEEVIQARVSFARLTLKAAWATLYKEDGTALVPVSLAVPYEELSARRAGSSVAYRVEYLVRLVDGQGNEVSKRSDYLTLSFPEDKWQKLGRHQLSLEESLEAPPGEYKLQAYLRDNDEDKVGSFEATVAIATREPGTFALSSLLIADALAESTGGSSGPFQFGSIRVVPSVDRTFTSDRSLNLYLQAYGASTKDDGRKKLKLEFFVMKDGRLFMGVPSSFLFPTTEPVGIRASIPLAKCPPGDYAIRVRVTDEVGSRSAEREAAFRVADPPPVAR